MNTQPEALRLADELCAAPERSRTSFEAAAELRRLHEVNQELLEALEWCADTLAVFVDDGSAAPDSVVGKNLTAARAAIAKAQEQK